ncbi:MAG: DUF2304 family protein [Lawsonibacter sp.]|nr:DUF2304 family protein [Lawsonibacter sp.]
MGITAFMRCAIVGVGLLLAGSSVWFYAKKRMTSDLAATWCLLGVAVIVVGAVPAFSRWLGLISVWTGIALLCVGAAALSGAFRICLMISQLITQNQELAMTVSLLLAERRENGDGIAEGIQDYEKNSVCH